MAEGK